MQQKRKCYLRMLALAAFFLFAGMFARTPYIYAAEAGESTQIEEGSDNGADKDPEKTEDLQEPGVVAPSDREDGGWKITVYASGRIRVSLNGYQLCNVYLILREHAQNGYEVVSQPDTSGDVYFFDNGGYGKKYLKTGIVPVLGDLGEQYYYVKNGAVSVSKSNRYVVSGGYLYEVLPSGEASVRILDKKNPGTYRRICQGMCYLVSYKTGEAKKYTGIFRGVSYKDGKAQTISEKTGTSGKAYYIIYKKHCYKVTASGNRSIYVKDSKKKGTYKKEIEGICYQISYKTGEAKKYTGWYKDKYYKKGEVKKYTGWYKDKYYKKGKLYTGWLTIASEQYYLEKGKQKTGWVTIGKKQYYFSKSGKLLKNQIIGSRYVDKKGVRVDDKVVNEAVKFVNKHSSASNSRSVRLKECYDYLWQKIPYFRTYGIPGRADMDDIAYSMMRNKYGNCFCYASTFAYIARVLGYDSRVTIGELPSRRGGMTPHGWAEIKVNGKWLFCDPDMQMNYPHINVYMRTESEYVYRHNIHHRYYLSISNGKVKWKK